MRATALVAAALFGTTLAAWAPAINSDEVTSAPLADQQTEIRASIGGGSGRQPRLAIPAFLITGVDAEVQEASTTLAEVLWNDLDFEREFQMISQQGVSQIPAAPAEALPYDLWNQVGADEVLVGNVRRVDGNIQLDVRVMSVERKVSTFGRRYTCSLRGVRLCAHTIADEVHKERFGLDGVARTKFAFTSDRDGDRLGDTIEARSVKEVYVSDYDGHRASRVTTRGSLNLAPAWAPDSRAIVYQSHQSGFVDIYVQKLYEAQAQLARPARGTDRTQNFLPDWSPDGTRIAYASSKDGNWDIYVVNVDGSDMRQLTADKATDSSPTWSPNGTQIAFTSNRGGSNQIYMMSADGGPVTRLTSEPQRADRPTWAGGYIVYSAHTPDDRVEIKRIDVGTRKVDQLTDGASNESPTVAPNGRHIAFVTTRWGKNEQIAVMNLDGKNVRQVTFVGNNRYPSWSASPQGR